MPDPDDLLIVEEISQSNWQAREVYAKFGLAMYVGQVLEHEIVNLLSWSGISAGEYATYEQAESASSELFGKTMGTLKATLLRRRVDLGHLDDDLMRAVRLRNFLAHNYFRERAAAAMTREGREQMIAELDQAIEFFQEVDAKLTPFTLRIVEEFGLMEKLPEVAEESKGKGFGQPLPGLSDPSPSAA
jgi:hypothetical protein